MFLSGALVVMSSFLVRGGPAAVGWTSYVPLSDPTWEPGAGSTCGSSGWRSSVSRASSASINFIVTIYTMRAPGMRLFRMPIFTWNILVTALLILFAFPVLTAALAMLFIDRRLGGTFFEPALGGDAVLWQHLFWFFGHPEVYILILPFFGVITEIISVFSRRPVFGYFAFVLATIAIAEPVDDGLGPPHVHDRRGQPTRTSASPRSRSRSRPASSSSTGSRRCGAAG